MSFPIHQGLFKYDLTDHYAILGIPIDADTRQIRQGYLKIAYILHPDTFQGKTEPEKQQANKLLSKLVNPAYELLSKERSRQEYLLILSQMGQNLASELSSITVTTDEAKQLLDSSRNAQPTYQKLILSLAAQQYDDLEQILIKTAQISELNLIYLMIQQGKEVKAKSRTVSPLTSPKTEKAEPDDQPISAIAISLRRAQENINRNNVSQAIIELREVLKKDPNNSICHGLLGLAYLKGNQPTMAKVHINKAWKANPKDPVVVEAKKALDKLMSEDSKNKASNQQKEGGLFSSLFGKKNN